MRKILLTCVLLGSWAVPGFVNAPQHAHSIIETLETIEVWICPDKGSPAADGQSAVEPSAGIILRHATEFDGVPHQSDDVQACVVDGELSSWTYKCKGMPQPISPESFNFKAGPAGWFASH